MFSSLNTLSSEAVTFLALSYMQWTSPLLTWMGWGEQKFKYLACLCGQASGRRSHPRSCYVHLPSELGRGRVETRPPPAPRWIGSMAGSCWGAQVAPRQCPSWLCSTCSPCFHNLGLTGAEEGHLFKEFHVKVDQYSRHSPASQPGRPGCWTATMEGGLDSTSGPTSGTSVSGLTVVL